MGSRVAEHDFGYLQSMLLKDENRLWAVCRLKALVTFPKNNPLFFSRKPVERKGTQRAKRKCAQAIRREVGGWNEPRRIFVVAVVRGLGVQGAGLAPDRHPADPHWASAKTRISDTAAARFGQMDLG